MNIKTNSPTLTVTSNSFGVTATSSSSLTNYGSATCSSASSINWGTASISTVGYFSTMSNTVTYHILGQDVEVEGYKDSVTALYISMINLMGKPFYDEVKKNGVDFSKEIEDYLSKALVTWERNRKLDIIL